MKNHNELLSLFEKLASISSETENEKNISDFCVNFFKKEKINVQQQKNENVFAKIENSSSDFSILLNAHLDTVSPGNNIKVITKNGIIKSAGSTILGADNKTSLAVILIIAKHFTKKRLGTFPSLEILLTVSEESDNIGAKNFNYQKLNSTHVLMADSVSPIGSLVIASPAYVSFDGILVGKSAHASSPVKGSNVLLPFAEFLKKINPGKNKNRTLNIGKLQAGTTRNTFPEELTFHGEIRCFDKNFLEKEIRKIKKVARDLRVEFKLSAFDIYFKKENEEYKINRNDFVVKKIRKSIKKVTKKEVTTIKNWACSDANIFSEKSLIPVNIGDGVYNAHSTREFIKTRDLKKLYEIFNTILKDLSS